MDAGLKAQSVKQANPFHIKARPDGEHLAIGAKVLRLYCREKFLRRAETPVL